MEGVWLRRKILGVELLLMKEGNDSNKEEERREQHSSYIPLATSSEVPSHSFGEVFVLSWISLLFHPLSDFHVVPPKSLRNALLA